MRLRKPTQSFIVDLAAFAALLAMIATGTLLRYVLPAGTDTVLTMSRRLCLVALTALLISGLSACTTPVGAEVAQPAPLATSRDGAAARFAAEVFPAIADSFGVPGAVFAVVGRGGTLALEGYGYADLAARRPADPERTLFRVGSVSKPVTATAALQHWERGAWSLHADVNEILKGIEVPEAFGLPITAHHLLTHTAGFDERIFSSGMPDRAPRLADYLRVTLPARVYPPGLLHSYSNHGYGVLGVIVEQESGLPFEVYVDRSVFGPLGMAHSTFAQPPESPFLERLATGYACGARPCTPLPYDYIAFGPAGALQTTAADMARFIAFHLSGTGGVLADSTRRRMHGPQWQPHPALGGMGYGLFRGMVGRYEALRHAGGWPGWSSQLVLVPKAGLGFFVAVNTDAHPFMEALLKRFAADVLGGPLPPPKALPGLELSRYAGTYRLARHVHRGAGKVALLVGLPMPDLRVIVEGGSALVLISGGTRTRVLAVAPAVFVRSGLDPGRYYFEAGERGDVVRLHTDYGSLERIPWWASRQVSLWVLALCLAAFGSAVGAWLLSRLRRPWREVPEALVRARSLAAGAAACHLLFVLGLAGALAALGPQGVLHPFPLWVRALFALPLVGAVLGLLTVPAAARVWRRRLGPAWSRLHYAAVTVAALAVVPILAYWNLLGFRL